MTEQINQPEPVEEKALESWKEIAAYLNRDVRTAKRWEKSEGLPVRRHMHLSRASVYAYSSELDAWTASRQPEADAVGVPRWRSVVALAAVILLTVLSVGSRSLLPSAKAASAQEMVARRAWKGAGLLYGALSPDGRLFSDVDWSTGDLVIRDSATMKILRRLTNKGTWAESLEYAELSIFSPDSSQLAYVWYNGKTYDLRVVTLADEHTRVVYHSPDASYVWPGRWSSNGKFVTASVALADRSSQIVLVPLTEGSPRVLKKFDWCYPDVGPFTQDGMYLVYDFPTREDSPKRDIFLLATDGSREVSLVANPANDRALSWGPDGQSLLFTSNRTGNPAIWSLALADGKPQGQPSLVKSDIGHILPLGFTADGSLYYGVRTSFRDAMVADLNLAVGKAASPKPVTENFQGTNSWLNWSPDGKYMVYVSERGYQSPGASFALVVRNVESGVETTVTPRLVPASGFDMRPMLSSDARFIFLAARDYKRQQGIYRVEVSSGEVTPVVQAAHTRLPALSPDEATLFYMRATPNGGAQSRVLVARDLKSGQEKEIYSPAAPLQMLNFSLSNNGQRLALILNDQAAGSYTLAVMPAAGGARHDLFTPQKPDYISHPAGIAWTPDDRVLLFWRRGELSRISAEGGSPASIEEGFPRSSSGPAVLGMTISPDGTKLALTAGDMQGEIWVLENFLPALRASQK